MKELSLHLLDLIENAVAAQATFLEVILTEKPPSDLLSFLVRDNGVGICPDLLPHAADPFTTTRTTRKVGLGLALLSAAAEQAGGALKITSEPGFGTEILARFQLSHLDRAPLGRLEDTLATAYALHPEISLKFSHIGPLGSYQIESNQYTLLPIATAIRKIKEAVIVGRNNIGSIA